MKHLVYVAGLSLSLILTGAGSLFSQDIKLIEAFQAEFDNPLGLEFSHSSSEYVYIVQRSGTIERMNINDPEASPERWFELPQEVFLLSEGGLLGLAFHPDYPSNESFFLNYTYEDNGQYKTRISRFLAPGGNADPASEQMILEFDQPASNHNGGALEFGPDGYLYISSGDGGGSGSRDNSQDISNLLGAILRIDIDVENGYGIPSDNPFVDDPDGMDEIYAWGLRNPWRMSFDRETDNLWVADVGPSSWEIIHIVERGKNYGYPIVVGSHCIRAGCDKAGLEMPVFEYAWGEDDTGRSITGGYVYRGSDVPSLEGKYIYGDYVSGRIWALEVDHDTWEVISNEELFHVDYNIASFGQDSNGEIYVLEFDRDGKIYRLDSDQTDDPDDPEDSDLPNEIVAPVLSISEENDDAVLLNWSMADQDHIDLYHIYRGPSIDDMSLLTTVLPGQDSYLDDNLPGETVFYSVTGVITGVLESDNSNLVSYYDSEVSMTGSWQLISSPLVEEIADPVAGSIYGFESVYTSLNSIKPSKGYMIRGEAGTVQPLRGIGLTEASIELLPGWNLIGGLSGHLGSGRMQDPEEILPEVPLYEYHNGVYTETAYLRPETGYWIYANSSGEIRLELGEKSSLTGATEGLVSAVRTARELDLNAITFQTGNAVQALWISGSGLPDDEKSRFLMPPVAPEPRLDVRTSDGYRVIDNRFAEIEIKASAFPVMVSAPQTESDQVYRIVAKNANDNEIHYNLTPGSKHSISGSYESFIIERASSDELITETHVDPNYPNPFNPATNIRYQLAESVEVLIQVYDSAGRRVATLVNEQQQPGQYVVQFDGRNLASGIYFLHLRAGNFSDIQKLTLIK